ncbi:glycosyltransferase family 4 protein [uncultured Maribacter sp.]|uniref:glycosyltransferase family 4 protein n=1 Tax=uncultured Maribacter sp. TaxID=431308 RepID=UPI002631F04F|nr:glycosyltransferase family 4 protein [uncultured Maribacter sp.]
MQKILLSAYACDPSKGSEPGNGYNWAKQLALLGYEIHCITTSKGKSAIKQKAEGNEKLNFTFVDLPFGLDKIYSTSKLGMYLHYFLWQWRAYRVGKKLHKTSSFDLVHHITWGSVQQGSFMYKLPIPMIFGPAGGGQKSPEALRRFFLGAWKSEEKREFITNKFIKYNPACFKMVKKASVILASNIPTKELVESLGCKNTKLVLDVGLPKAFYPKVIPKRKIDKENLKLLWVGRFMPRKGLILLLEVMNELKSYPNIELTIVGDGEMKEILLQGIEKYDLKNTNWVGKVPFNEVPNYYASHDLFVFSSLRDSVGVQLIEAMAYGLPIITLDLNGASLLVDDTRGIKIPVKDSEQIVLDFAKAIIALSKDSVRLEQMSNNAFDYSKQFIWEDKIKDIADKYYPKP